MTLQELAEKTLLPLAKIKATAAEMFGTAKDLTQEQIEELASTLQDAAEMASLPPAKRQAEVLSIKQLNQTTGSEIEKTIKIVGLNNLKKSKLSIDRLIADELTESLNNIETAATIIEDYAVRRISQAYIAAAENIRAVQEEFKENKIDYKSIVADVRAGKKPSFQEQYPNVDIDLLKMELDMM